MFCMHRYARTLAHLFVLCFLLLPTLRAEAIQRILLYQDAGTSPFCVEQTYAALIDVVSRDFRVELCDANTLLNTAWEKETALLVIPGGRSMPYHKKLDPHGSERIRRFVENGGQYLGLCAGGYFGARQTVFYPGHPTMEIFSESLLDFYPGTCQGPVYTDFAYQSEAGAHAAPLAVVAEPLIDQVGAHIAIYNNGGGAFVDAHLYPSVQVLARYQDVSAEAAIVACAVGQGQAILTGVHPEFNVHQLQRDPTRQSTLAKTLEAYEPEQRALWRYLMAALGVAEL